MTRKTLSAWLGKTLLAAVLPWLCALASVPAFAQSAEVRAAGVYYVNGTSDINGVYCNWSATKGSNPIFPQKAGKDNNTQLHQNYVGAIVDGSKDPWKYSALIEYDQPYPNPNSTNNYPNHCLALCMDVYCTNKPNGASTYSVAFPIQNIKYEIAKYYGSKDVSNPETNPPVRTIFQSLIDNKIVDGTTGQEVEIDIDKYSCASYVCYGAKANFEDTTTCPSPKYVCESEGCTGDCCTSLSDPTKKASTSTAGCVSGDKKNGQESPCIIKSGAGKGYNDPIHFCTSWDGSYEILGEFGKTNGQFGFRGNIQTNYPGDGMAVETINIDQTYVYPGNNQYPIQVDVTNVHTVRTTPTVIGSLTAVQAAPYAIAYRLSKDADVKIQIFDASQNIVNSSSSNFTTTGSCANIITSISDQTTCENGPNGTWASICGQDVCCAPRAYDERGSTLCSAVGQPSTFNADTLLRRTLVDWQPRMGEGMKGADSDKLIVESDSWDGRDDSGRLLPAGNYLVSIQAKTQDEWSGTDFSRAVTRQLSLDPLKLTDIQVFGLNKQSTGYAMVYYVPTEASNVYFEVYSPGTTFDSTFTKGSDQTGTSPKQTTNSGVRVYHSQQQRGRAMSYPDKWDGLCHETDGCAIPYAKGTKLPISGNIFNTADDCTEGTEKDDICTVTFAEGSPLPDGDYVYVLWAEVPYTSEYTNAAGDTYQAVKTQRYYTGLLPVERGVVDITIQPVSYSTVGSSPTAYGLDPFIFRYSIARDAIVNAYVRNTAGVTVKTLTDRGGNSNVAQQMNTLVWDGRDDQGRMVGPGTYMFVVETSDPMFPQSVKTQAATLFPVDLYRVVDVSTTDVYGDSEAKATLSYKLSKAMNVQVNIYNKDVVIPAQNESGETAKTTTQSQSQVPAAVVPLFPAAGVTAGDALGKTYTYTAPGIFVGGIQPGMATKTSDPVKVTDKNQYEYYVVNYEITSVQSRGYNFVIRDITKVTIDTPVTAWPPRVCDKTTDRVAFVETLPNGSTQTCPTAAATCFVDPAAKPSCIYVNDKTFTHYPATPLQAQYNYAEGAAQTLDVRLQPIKTFNRSALKAGDGVTVIEEWDAQYFYNPTPVSVALGGKNPQSVVNACANQSNKTACPYEMVPDGTYPFYIAPQTNEPVDIYYNEDNAAPVRSTDSITAQTGLYATDKPVYRVNITRGPVYFLDGSVAVYPNAPQLFNTSSGPVFVPPYEINFSISRAAMVEVSVVALQDGLCSKPGTVRRLSGTNVYDAKAGDVCKFLSTMTIPNTATFDPNIVRKVYWDGTDNNGYYVKNGNYEIRLTAKNYPDEGLYEATVKQLTLSVDLLKVYDLPETEAYAINKRGTDMKISYQISVPMKVAIQIFKPGTTVFDYQRGTLRDPATGKEVTNIRDVLVKSIVGIRPATTLIEEVWDGTDYAGQDVPDGTYPFRFVTALNSADIDTITGEILPGSDERSSGPLLLGGPENTDFKINYVADAYQYANLHHATVAIGDGEFVCEDWEKTVFFYPNPFKTPTGTLEITKLPVPGKLSIKLYNLAGDLVREGGYTCVDAHNQSFTLSGSADVQPDNSVSDSTQYTGNMPTLRNAALRCFWDKTNDHRKKVARGVYFGLVDFRAQNGRQHCQKVVKILIPR